MSFYVSVELYEILTLFSGEYITAYALYMWAKFFDRLGNKVQPWAKSPALQPIRTTLTFQSFALLRSRSIAGHQSSIIDDIIEANYLIKLRLRSLHHCYLVS